MEMPHDITELPNDVSIREMSKMLWQKITDTTDTSYKLQREGPYGQTQSGYFKPFYGEYTGFRVSFGSRDLFTRCVEAYGIPDILAETVTI